jgi:hypothetical protein
MLKELPTLDRLSREDEKEKLKRRLRWTLAGLILLFFVGDRVVNGKRGEAYHQRLAAEFSAIPTLPNSLLVGRVDRFSDWAPRKTSVGATYSSTTRFSDIQLFYDHALQSHGWHLAESRSLTEWGKDLGGRELVYCKGELAASVEYAGLPPQRGWTYALRMSWGLHQCK